MNDEVATSFELVQAAGLQFLVSQSPEHSYKRQAF
jgi:hypothetical protein